MKKHILLTGCLSLALVGCGGSSGGSSDTDTGAGQTGATDNLLSAESVELMTDTLALANQLQTEIETLNSQPQNVSFLARMNSGEESTLVTQGPISLKAVCNNSGDIVLTYRSTAEGTLSEGEFTYMYDVDTDYRWGDLDNTDAPTVHLDPNSLNQGSVVAPSGDAILFGGDKILYGTDVQGSDCLVAGSVMVIKGAEAPEFTVPVPF